MKSKKVSRTIKTKNQTAKRKNSTKKATTVKTTAPTKRKPEVQIQVSDPQVNEIAGQIGYDLERFQSMHTNDPNPIYKNPKFTGLQLFYDMDTDSRIYNTMRILKDGLRRRQSWIRPGDNSEDQAIKTAFVIYNLKKIENLKQKKAEIMACLDYGYSVTEKILDVEDVNLEYEFNGEKKSFFMKGAVVVKDLKSRPVTAFWFDENNRVYFAGNMKESPFFGLMRNGREGRLLSDRELQRLMIVTHDARFGSKYGYPVKVPMFPPYLTKKAAKVWRLMHVHHHAMPIPHGKYPRGPGAPGKAGVGGTDEFKKKLAGLHQAVYLMTPEGFAVDFLKAMQTGDLDPYQNLLDYSDYEIAESGLGHREATSQAGTGSYASEVLKSTAIRQEIHEANGGTLDTGFNDQLIKPLLDWNFPSTGIYSKQDTETTAMRDQSATIANFQIANTMVPLKASQIYRDMSYEQPDDPTDTVPVNNSMTFPDRSKIKEKLSAQDLDEIAARIRERL